MQRESIVFLGGGRAALLQLAHPFVAHAVAQHSGAVHPFRRFAQTFAQVFPMAYGTLGEALAAARKVHRVHSYVRGQITEDLVAYPAGTPYEANDAAALLWVHATLWDTSVKMFELVVRKLRPDERQAYYEETKRFAALFGIPPTSVPPNWESFQAYFQDMISSDTLQVGKAAKEIGSRVLHPHPLLVVPSHHFSLLTMGLLPERIRHQYRAPLCTLEWTTFHAQIAAIQLIYSALPQRCRHVWPYQNAFRRVQAATSEAARPRSGGTRGDFETAFPP